MDHATPSALPKKSSLRFKMQPTPCRRMTPSLERIPSFPISNTTPRLKRRCHEPSVPATRIRRRGESDTSSTPGASDRFVPSRRSMNMDLCRRALFSEGQCDANNKNQTMLSELAGIPVTCLNRRNEPRSLLQFGRQESTFEATGVRERRHFERKKYDEIYMTGILPSNKILDISWGAQGRFAILYEGAVVFCDNNVQRDILYLRNATSIAWCTLPNKNHILAVGCFWGAIVLFDTNSHKCVGLNRKMAADNPEIMNQTVFGLEWDSPYLTAITESAIFILDCDLNEIAAIKTPKVDSKLQSFKWNDGSTQLAAISRKSSTVRIYDAAMISGQKQSGAAPRVSFSHISKNSMIARHGFDWCPFSRDTFAFGGSMKDITFWDTNQGTLRNTIEIPQQNNVASLQFSRHSMEMIACFLSGISSKGNYRQSMRFWKNDDDSSNMTLTHVFPRESFFTQIALCPSNGRLAAVASQGIVEFWDAFDTQLLVSNIPRMETTAFASQPFASSFLNQLPILR